jgi:hypothetical protein
MLMLFPPCSIMTHLAKCAHCAQGSQAIEFFHQLAEIGTDQAIFGMPNTHVPVALDILQKISSLRWVNSFRPDDSLA